MDTGPRSGPGHDLALTELTGDSRHELVLEVGTERGARVAAAVPHRQAGPADLEAADELMRAASIVVEPNTVAAHVKAIRDAFLAIDAGFDCIRTERGKGYRWLPR